jgi:hypothetical protein
MIEAADQIEQAPFAEPDGPMIETISPRGITRLTSVSAVTRRLPSNCLGTWWSSIMAVAVRVAEVEEAAGRLAMVMDAMV